MKLANMQRNKEERKKQHIKKTIPSKSNIIELAYYREREKGKKAI